MKGSLSIMQDFAGRLRIVKIAKGLTDEQAARDMQVTSRSFGNYINKRSTPNIEAIKNFCTAHPDVSAEWLIMGTEQSAGYNFSEANSKIEQLQGICDQLLRKQGEADRLLRAGKELADQLKRIKDESV